MDANSLAGQRRADRLLILQRLLGNLHVLGVDSVDVASVVNPERLECLGTSREREECSHQKEIVALRRRAGASKKTSEKTEYFRTDYRNSRKDLGR